MTIKDLKVGMKVWIREDLKTGVKYGDDCFVEEMQELKCLQTVGELYNKSFNVKEDSTQYHFTNEMVDWEKTEKLNKQDTELIYDGSILKGQINGQEIRVVRSGKDSEDLEKACMMALPKSLGATYKDVKELESKVKKVWKPAIGEYYYFVTSVFDVILTRNEGVNWEMDMVGVGNCFRTKEEAEKKAAEVRKLFKE